MTAPATRGYEAARESLGAVGKVLQGFREFIARGNAIELAVGVVIGSAFTAIVTVLTTAFVSPLIGWVFGTPSLATGWKIGPYSWSDDADPIDAGAIVNALISFLLTAAAVYFLIVLPLNALAARRKSGQADEPKAPAEDVLLLQEIRDLLAAQATPALRNDTAAAPGTVAGGPAAPPTPRATPPQA
ncbi:large conductance mechanosensitive channel protein MscL [Cellulomonas marina]|uniref:Large-conductance mechanosensitive channel n=1 Tax=Cellulomonas marina TaxID=988821 RepID=A0A1I0X787_9CELL|nr:large conductance mechanosensitive channel protein MscL [Cellulomonas marina]GIG28966.1 hypothetical protein Cma02nite_15660 [Cellulomonas marina]SFA96266.1 large conductance mechanosensitive channel [Cellulomonas marina]